MAVAIPRRPDLVGKALKDRRVKLGMTQRELANAANVSVQSVTFYESGMLPKRESDVLKAICAVLGL